MPRRSSTEWQGPPALQRRLRLSPVEVVEADQEAAAAVMKLQPPKRPGRRLQRRNPE
tara:strand:+ start:1490 stop:1660 length:171 start_codon:yes stop_codon:yes gene_type:complete